MPIEVIDAPALFEQSKQSGINNFVLGRELMIMDYGAAPVIPPDFERMEDPDEYIDLNFTT